MTWQPWCASGMKWWRKAWHFPRRSFWMRQAAHSFLQIRPGAQWRRTRRVWCAACIFYTRIISDVAAISAMPATQWHRRAEGCISVKTGQRLYPAGRCLRFSGAAVQCGGGNEYSRQTSVRAAGLSAAGCDPGRFSHEGRTLRGYLPVL